MRRAHVDAAVIDALRDGRLALPDDAAHRFTRVLRLPAGEVVEVFDGTGRVARGALTGDGGALEGVSLEAKSEVLPPLVVAQALVTSEKLELVVKKGTELGASAFWLVDCARGQVHLTGAKAERAEKKRERLVRVAEDACRQSGRARVPAVEGPMSVKALAERVRAFPGLTAVGVVTAQEPLSEVLAARPRAEQGMCVVVGPEGGLDEAEVQALVAAGAVPVRLGAHVLRTETAALVALSAAQVRYGHL